jgi:hypothetical protein
MSKPIKRIYNCETGEIIDREMTDAEFADFQIQEARFESQQAEAEAKATQKAALLERLGISEDEARLLLA